MSRTQIHRIASIFAGLVLLSAPVPAQEATSAQPTWKVIAKKSIRFRGLIQRINLQNFAEPVRSLKVRIRGRRMTFSSIKVRFGNGTVHHERRRIRLRSGETSSAFAASNQARPIDEIILIPDVSAPRRRVIGIEILALVGAKTAPQENTTTAPPAATSTPENGQAGTRAGANTKSDATRSVVGSETTDTNESDSVDHQRKVPKTKPVSTAKLNTSSVAETNVALPPAKPKPKVKSLGAARTSISLGSPTRGGELLLGRGSISPDSNVVRFDLSDKPNRLKRLRLYVSGSNLRINNVVIVYEDDKQLQEAFDVVQRRNTMSRWINLDSEKPITRLELHSAATATKTGAARIELLGVPILDSQLPGFARLPANNDWFLIAAQSGRMIRGSDGHMPVASNRGGFSELRLVRIGRSPVPRKILLTTNKTEVSQINLSAAQASNNYLLTAQQRFPIEDLQLSLSSRAIDRISNSDVFQIWAKF